jgi:hypothetical protein
MNRRESAKLFLSIFRGVLASDWDHFKQEMEDARVDKPVLLRWERIKGYAVLMSVSICGAGLAASWIKGNVYYWWVFSDLLLISLIIGFWFLTRIHSKRNRRADSRNRR